MKDDPIKRNSRFIILYKEIQNEIKNIVINNLHRQIGKLIKELEKLKKENTIIKNDLFYILKKFLLLKENIMKFLQFQTLIALKIIHV